MKNYNSNISGGYDGASEHTSPSNSSNLEAGDGFLWFLERAPHWNSGITIVAQLFRVLKSEPDIKIPVGVISLEDENQFNELKKVLER